MDFYESETSVTTYADCETRHEHRMWDSGARDEARGEARQESRDGSIDVTVRLTGFTDTGSLSGSWYRELADGDYWFEEFRGRGPTDNGDGTWLLSLETDPATRWWLAVSELDGGLVTWGMASGGAITDTGEDVFLDLELTDSGLVTSSWDGATDPRVTSVRVTQEVMSVADFSQLPLPILESVPTGSVDELVMVAAAGQGVRVAIQRDDLMNCDYHSQRWDLQHEVARTLEVPELYDVFALSNGSGEGDWRFRPEVRWDNVPDDPDGDYYGYFYAAAPDDWMSWTLETSFECEMEMAAWPALWDEIPAESFGWLSAYYHGAETFSACSSSIEFPSL